MEQLRPLSAGAVTALVGFTSSFAVVLAGLRAAGATESQAASGLLTVCVVQGLIGIWLSTRSRMPVGVAWSTPGAALLIASGTPRGGFAVAVAAFIVCGLLIIATGLIGPLRSLVMSIPGPIANALLAGVLLEICLVPVTTARERPGLAVPIIGTWLLLTRIARPWAVPGAMLVAVVEIVTRSGQAHLPGHSLTPSVHFTAPHFGLPALALGLSLFIVTMASQNLPGLAVLHGLGFDPPLRSVLLHTGIGTVAGSVLGGHVVNLAAITQALTAGPDVHPDRAKRWIATTFAGCCHIAFGLAAGLLSALVAVAPSGLVETVAGLALLATLGSSLAAATAQHPHSPPAAGYREAAVLTFLVTASGFSIAGIGSAFWGLATGLLMTGSTRLPRLVRVPRGSESRETRTTARPSPIGPDQVLPTRRGIRLRRRSAR